MVTRSTMSPHCQLRAHRGGQCPLVLEYSDALFWSGHTYLSLLMLVLFYCWFPINPYPPVRLKAKSSQHNAFVYWFLASSWDKLLSWGIIDFQEPCLAEKCNCYPQTPVPMPHYWKCYLKPTSFRELSVFCPGLRVPSSEPFVSWWFTLRLKAIFLLPPSGLASFSILSPYKMPQSCQHDHE